MRRILAIILSIALLIASLSGCGNNKTVKPEANSENQNSQSLESDAEDESQSPAVDWNQEVKFTGMADANLLPYIEDTVYQEMVSSMDSDEYFVEDISAIYISQEYINELSYNSQQNVFFGYSLSELDSCFEGTRYVFTLGDDGQTAVKPLEIIEDTTYEDLIRNVAIGTGVILVCVTVSAVTAGAGVPAVSMIFAVAAKTGATCALSGAAISGVSSAVVRGYQTGDFAEALKAGALGASEGYKWGAISGAVSGAAAETWGLYSATRVGATVKDGLTMNQAALIQKESGFPLNVIKQFHTYDEYLVFKNAGLQTQMINGKLALVRTDINLNQLDEYGKTNLARMMDGKAPLDSAGNPFELHHIGQKNDGTLAILTRSEHDNAALHGYVKQSEIDRTAFNTIREEFWKAMAKALS